MKKKIIIISLITVITLIFLLCKSIYVATGFMKRTDVWLYAFSVSEDGTEITLYTDIGTSMGYTRGFKDNGGGVKPHYLIFYSTFGGLNSPLGAKSEHILKLDEDDNEIYFYGGDGGYHLVLQKDEETGEWGRP